MPDVKEFSRFGYARRYTVVSKGEGTVTLRPVEGTAEGLFESYWKVFVRGSFTSPDGAPLVVKIRRLPQGIQKVMAGSPLSIEYPEVSLVIGGTEVDVSSQVTAARPDTSTPGLYAICYMLPLPGDPENEVCRSYVSIEEPPVLRHVITPWNRESYTVANLNRLVLEPQFQEALYEEGAPLYNFVTSNTGPALRPAAVQQLAGATVAKKDGALFVSGPKLPLASSIVTQYGTWRLSQEALTGEWAPTAYAAGSLVMKNRRAYLAVEGISATDIPGATPKWLAGYAYTLDAAGPTGAPEGILRPSAIWAPVDLRGYTFLVDALHCPPLGTYWGHYGREYFYDYRPGDLVAYVQDGALSIYRRNDTDIRDLADEDAYRPGHYKNPHWEEAYSCWDGGERYVYLQPMTNAADALVAKTGSLSEYMCSAYAQMMGIPDALVDAIGSKCSVFLYILLQRTRNTFEGLRYAFRAIGLDIEDLHRVYSTVEATGPDGEVLEGVYAEAQLLQHLAYNISQGLLWDKDRDPTDAEADYAAAKKYPRAGEGEPKPCQWVRYWPDPAHAGTGERPYSTVQAYSKGHGWATMYDAVGHGDLVNTDGSIVEIRGNNRYYAATVSLLGRLAESALADLGDSTQWVRRDAFPGISQAIAAIMGYEVPAYIRLVVYTSLYGEGHMYRSGLGMRWLDMAAAAGTPKLVLYRAMVLGPDLAPTPIRGAVEVPSGDTWVAREPDEARDGCDIYYLNGSPRFRIRLPGDYTASGYWVSEHTLGTLLMLPAATERQGVLAYQEGTSRGALGWAEGAERGGYAIMGGYQFELYSGEVGMTPLIGIGALHVTMEYMAWQYHFDGTWLMDGTTPFAALEEADCTVLGAPPSLDAGAVQWLAGQLALVQDGEGRTLSASWEAEDGALYVVVQGSYPGAVRLCDASGNCLLSVTPAGYTYPATPNSGLSVALTIEEA